MPMDRSPDRMDLDVGGDDRQTWWERLTKDSVRMRELAGKVHPACFPIDASKTWPEVDNTLREEYYDQHPSHPPGEPIPSFSTACAHTMPVIIDILRQNHPNASVSKGGMGAFSISSFLNESYPGSAPFDGEALHSRAGDGAGDGDSVASSNGSSGRPRSDGSLSVRERPGSHPRDSQPHQDPRHGKPTTHTLSGSTKYSPGRSSSDSPGASGSALSDVCPSTNESTISSFSSTLNTPSCSRTPSHSRSVLNQGHPPIHTGHHFDVPRSRSMNGTGPGGQHKCDKCGREFPYPSKLKDHKHIHQPDKPLPCSYHGCLKKFKRTRELQAHKKTHDRRAAAARIPPPGQFPAPPPPPQHPLSPLGPGGCSSKSKPSGSDGTSPTSPEDESTLFGSPSPASSHTDGRVATSEPPVVDRQGREMIHLEEPGPEQHKFNPRLSYRLDRQLFPDLR